MIFSALLRCISCDAICALHRSDDLRGTGPAPPSSSARSEGAPVMSSSAPWSRRTAEAVWPVGAPSGPNSDL